MEEDLQEDSSKGDSGVIVTALQCLDVLVWYEVEVNCCLIILIKNSY